MLAALISGLASTPANISATVSTSVPAGFIDELVTQVPLPTALAFTPDGRMLVTSQSGQVWINQNGALLPEPALDLSSVTCSNVERGLMGVTVDPNVNGNQFIYLYYTYKKYAGCPIQPIEYAGRPVNRVARFTLPDSNVISMTSQTVLIDNIGQLRGGHTGGDMHFGQDGLLYVAIGDGDDPNRAATWLCCRERSRVLPRMAQYRRAIHTVGHGSFTGTRGHRGPAGRQPVGGSE